MIDATGARWRADSMADDIRQREGGRVQTPLGKEGVSMQSTPLNIPYAATPLSCLLCPRCGSPRPHRTGPGSGPHHQRLLCGACGGFIKWLPKPRTVTQEVRHA